MVLPTPPPDDASGANEPAFVARLKRILQLADRGVLVLVEGAPHALGPIVRGLLPEYPDLLVETRAERLFTAEKGQVVIFVPNLDEAASLNLNRPILSERELKVVLVCDKTTAGKLAHAAPDFFHWISHWIEGPKGPLPEATARLREAIRRRPIGIAWVGGLSELESSFALVMPSAPIVVRSVRRSVRNLVRDAIARPKRTWIVWTDAESPAELAKLRHAWQHAGRRGRNLILMQPPSMISGYHPAIPVRIDATMIALDEATNRLEAYGLENPGRLAALTDLALSSFEKVEQLIEQGYSGVDLERELVARKPWEVIDELLRLRAKRNQEGAARPVVAEDDATFAVSLLDRARSLERQGVLDDAESLVRDGLGIYERLFGIDDARTRGVVARLTQLLKARGRYGEAILEWLRLLPDHATKPGPRHPEWHWLHGHDVNAARELVVLVSRLQNLELARRAHKAVRAALGDEAKETKALAAWVERLSAPKDS